MIRRNRISIKTIEHSLQRYNCLDDWRILYNEDLDVIVSNTGLLEYNALILIHGLIEAVLCNIHGITTEQVDKWDLKCKDDDPGMNPKAPYHSEHMDAIAIEKIVCCMFGLDWKQYEDHLEKLCKTYKKGKRK
jgi:hypothetical protein